MQNLPKRTADYLGPITDTTRWDDFTLRSDDIVIATPVKCGTTWSQGIAAMMVFGKVDFEGSLTDISPWVESATRPLETVNSTLSAQTHRRVLKSHTPMDGIPYDLDVTYIAVYRHPLDVHFSMRNHVSNMVDSKLDHLFPADASKGALMFINDSPPAQDCDHLTLATIVNHYKSFKKWAHLPNIHMFHYADMKADLPKTMKRFADIFGYDFPPAKMAELIEGATFDSMRKKPDQFAPAAGMDFFKDDAKFFHSASSNKWEKHLTENDIELYRARLSNLLEETDRIWLENGSFG